MTRMNADAIARVARVIDAQVAAGALRVDGQGRLGPATQVAI